MLIVNPLLHEAARRRIQKDFDAVNYSVAMVFAMRKIKRLKNKLGRGQEDVFTIHEHLLRRIGFDEAIVQKAHDRVDHYMESGYWREERGTRGM